MTGADVLSPREIVAALHEEMAARSPELAALVAAYEAVPRTAPRPLRQPRPAPVYAARRRRMTVYAQLRIAGAGPKAAARKAGVGRESTANYEADFLGAMGGAR
jgi:hypothetical protein